jgi:hypothetical protein
MINIHPVIQSQIWSVFGNHFNCKPLYGTTLDNYLASKNIINPRRSQLISNAIYHKIIHTSFQINYLKQYKNNI